MSADTASLDDDLLLNLLNDSSSQDYDTLKHSAWTRDYLARLTTLPLDSLLAEPDQLRAEQTQMQHDAQQLAFQDYPAFLHSHTCRKQVDTTLDDLDAHLHQFVAAVPGLQQACQTFSETAASIVDDRRKALHVLEHQNVLVDLLEIPQLMETCVWNGYYSEAMDLASHARLLVVRYPVPIVQSIQKQVQQSADLMLVQLLAHLRRPIKLAAAMNVIGHLRRMDAFETETELRVIFLRCRHDFLMQRLDRIKVTENAFEYLKRYVDIMREQMFEIATHYTSVFSQHEQQTIMILSDYMVQLIGHMRTTLEHHLTTIDDTSALASLLTQLQYCGMSLGRIGLDFRHMFVTVFEDTVRPLILRWIDSATEELVANIAKATLTPSAWMSASKLSQHQSYSHTTTTATTKRFQPPMLLVDYPPLAVFTNAILSTLNALRLIPAANLLRSVQSHLDACFLEIGSALKQYADQIMRDLPDEVVIVHAFTSTYVRCCVPYLRSCLLDGIYSEIRQHDEGLEDKDLETLLEAHLPPPDLPGEDTKQVNEETTHDEKITQEEATDPKEGAKEEVESIQQIRKEETEGDEGSSPQREIDIDNEAGDMDKMSNPMPTKDGQLDKADALEVASPEEVTESENAAEQSTTSPEGQNRASPSKVPTVSQVSSDDPPKSASNPSSTEPQSTSDTPPSPPQQETGSPPDENDKD
ncbi:Dor1-like family-domain-containing protein [Syncephalastrum racemosum]|uniref:Conserved oligomeric Golgi complex subunit 8 n=1 Tax=Syncephalastrum racemosum TaxID=13706 RepID=A0A1X2H395_SYNRA|nr:Dor1-like family-domain-containing protein [Syncephalastrum racemosum]